MPTTHAPTNSLQMNNPVSAAPMKYLDKAQSLARDLGLVPPAEITAPAVSMVSQLGAIDEGRVVVLARLLQQSSHFNQVMRDEIASTEVSDRYDAIISGFDSIRDDGKRMVEQLSDGRIDLRERIQNIWMKVTRGDIPSRFEAIRRTFLDVSEDSADQITREARIIEMYGDYRLAVKEGTIIAAELHELQSGHLSNAKQALDQAQAAVASSGQDLDEASRGRLELARDEAMRRLQDEDARYQIAKDIADNLQVAYSTSEAIMARVHQSHEVKKRVYQRSITFFSTNESVFTALNAAFVSQQGLHETTSTLNAMVDGVNKSLESVAEIGDQVLHQGLKAGYGATVGADAVRKLVDAVVRFQETSLAEIAQLRQEATQNAADIAGYVEQGKKRYAALVAPSGTAGA